MELKAIYLSYTTWSSIHNQKTESHKDAFTEAGGGGLVWAGDNEHDEKERRWRLRKDDTVVQWWRMTQRWVLIPDRKRMMTAVLSHHYDPQLSW